VASGLIFSRLGGLLSGWSPAGPCRPLMYGLLALTIERRHEEDPQPSEVAPAAVAA